MRALTGIDFRMIPSAPAEVRLPDGEFLGIRDDSLTPAFYVPPQPGVRLLGNYTGTDFAGFAENARGSHGLFSAAPTVFPPHSSI